MCKKFLDRYIRICYIGIPGNWNLNMKEKKSMKLELTQHEVLTILQALAFAGHYAKKDRGDEFFDLYDRIDEQLKKDGEE